MAIGAVAAHAAPEDESLIRLKKRIEASPQLYSLEDRLKLRQELNRRNLAGQSIYDNHQAAYYAIQGIEQSIHRTAVKRGVARVIKTGINVGMATASAVVTVGSAGTAAPAIGLVTGGLGLVVDPVFNAIDESILEDHQKAMRYHLGKMPRGTLRTREEAVASLRRMYGTDVLLSDLPEKVQKDFVDNPASFAIYQRERNNRVDAMLATVSEDVLDLQGQSLVHDYDIDQLKKNLARNTAFLSKFSAETKARLNNLERSQAEMGVALEQMESTLSEHSVQIDKNTQDMRFVSNWMAGKMSNGELVEAARAGFISIDEKELGRIKLIAKVEAFQAGAEKVFTIATSALTIATHFGLDEKTAGKISKAVAISQGAVQVASSLASGNVLAAFSVVASFFSGPDAATVRHQQVMEALGKIYELQVVILENQAKLSKQVEDVHIALLEARQDILEKLDTEFKRVHINAASMQSLLTDVARESRLDSCSNVLARYNQMVSLDPREVQSESSYLRLFGNSDLVRSTQSCRDNFFKLFFNVAGLGDLSVRDTPHKLLVHGVTVDQRRSSEVDSKWNSDQDFYALVDILELFRELNPALPNVDQVFLALQAETSDVNSVRQRSAILPALQDRSEDAGFFRYRMQPELVADIALQFRKMFPLLSRVSVDGFMGLDDLSPANQIYLETRGNNLKLAQTILRQLKVAEAQERLVGGAGILPQLLRFVREGADYFKDSPHTRRDALVREAALELSRVLSRNPYLAQNLAILMISQTSDVRMGFDRASAIARGDLSVPGFNESVMRDYRAAYTTGNLSALRSLLPRDWKLLCSDEMDAEMKLRWESTFHPTTSCRPDHRGEYSYSVRMRGFDALTEAGKPVNPKLQISFTLPAPEALAGEALLKSTALIKLEDESAALGDMLLRNQNLSDFSQSTLNNFDNILLGEKL